MSPTLLNRWGQSVASGYASTLVGPVRVRATVNLRELLHSILHMILERFEGKVLQWARWFSE